MGNWLSLRQAQALLNAPDVRTKKGLRDRAMFATLLGCGLRRSELTNLTTKHMQQRDNRWCIVDLGRQARVGTDDPDAGLGEERDRCVEFGGGCNRGESGPPRQTW